MTVINITARLNEPEILALLALSAYKPTEEKMAARASGWMANPAIHSYAIDVDGTLSGFAVAEMKPGELEILSIAAAPEARGKGIGRALIRALRERFPGLDLVAETDDEAVGFYMRCGFLARSLGEKYPGIVRYRCRLRAERPEHFRTLSAVMLFLVRERGEREELLLQRRQNTGYSDGMWDCAASGHVDMGESMTAAMAREAWEELGISVDPADVRFCTLAHKNWSDTGDAFDDIYYNAFFTLDRYEGTPSIREPEKCSELRWFPADELPEDLIADRARAWRNYKAGIAYSEEGW
jgi:8-oxo-dGTP pyrophosphatase MutT (NUDIX family)